MTENFPSLIKTMNTKIQETQQISCTRNMKKATPRNI